ncbi:MAG: protein-glutamate O-methyltransferase CheR [Pseudomonadales bacterium]|nr:protein-glutamate O-methyltransferase CheR [Pseudomonadales bacterium]
MEQADREDIEIELLLDAMEHTHGYDFRHYSRTSLKRRLIHRMKMSKLNRLSEMIPLVLYDEAFFELILGDLSISVTAMFRDKSVFNVIRDKIATTLQTYARVNVWHVGCSTGEEVYSLAILLQEEGLLDKTRLYATDFNKRSIAIAEKGIYSADKIDAYSKAYLDSGGNDSLSNYYREAYDSIKINDSLRKNITFAHHNLVKDGQFAEMHLILCRNVLIYFDAQLQNQVLTLLHDSLIHRGFLVLGNKESLSFTAVQDGFEEFDRTNRVYRKLDITGS